MAIAETVISPKRLTESDWRALSAEWESSDEPQESFCERRGISYNSFVYWRMKFIKARKHDAEDKPSSFAPITIGSSTSCVPSSMPSIQLILPTGIRLNLFSDVDKSALQKVLETLGALPC